MSHVHDVLNTLNSRVHDVLNTPRVHDVLNTDNYRQLENVFKRKVQILCSVSL